jgi:prepilin-type N-terminal cleavage/methylation domain-containing protein
MLKINEKGFTLIEVLVAGLILSAIMTVTTAAIIVTVKTTTQNTEWNVNLRQVQNAGNWISRDALMAQVVDIHTPGVFLNLSWSDWQGNSFNVDYIIQGNMLMRQMNGGTAKLIADYIDPLGSTCDWNATENKLIVTLRATVHDPDNSYAKTYEVCPRPVAKGG